MTLFFKGLIAGLFITGGLGPMGLLCLRRSLARGFAAGIATGFGAALADACCATIGVFSINFIADALADASLVVRALCGCFFIIMGIKIFSTPPKRSQAALDLSLFSDFTSSFFLTVANPATPFAVIALITSLGMDTKILNVATVATFVTAVFIGSFTWWACLSLSAQYLRTKINDKKLALFNKICGAGLMLFGCAALISLLLVKQ